MRAFRFPVNESRIPFTAFSSHTLVLIDVSSARPIHNSVLVLASGARHWTHQKRICAHSQVPKYFQQSIWAVTSILSNQYATRSVFEADEVAQESGLSRDSSFRNVGRAQCRKRHVQLCGHYFRRRVPGLPNRGIVRPKAMRLYCDNFSRNRPNSEDPDETRRG